ncbi:uncharacterized protein LOC123698717 [Colias croceus]|uniref:uncharacterized protein LOC123698717 n=1 Tax=Colias crocea TaxID=72248 RepID=UPI001E27AE0F|nr:uncharacterized protein LOC123698717 [Colias croceus]
MKKFEFVSKSDVSSFNGKVFYEIYKHAQFLKENDNVKTILNKSYQLRQMLKDVAPGEKVMVKNMWLTKELPLLVKKSGPNICIGCQDFTTNRVTGLAAAYAFDQRHRFPELLVSEALMLGLQWNSKCVKTARLYLSAVSGTEHFYDQFYFWPFLCALKKLEIKKITLQIVVKIAKVKNNSGVPMGRDMMEHLQTAKCLWTQFKVNETNFTTMLRFLPTELKLTLKLK